jgi:hypothetical protein
LCLALGAERGLEVIEEAALLHELSTRHSLGPLAERIGRDVSWVSRRLSLYGPCLRSYRSRYVPDECLYMGGPASWFRWRAPMATMPVLYSRGSKSSTRMEV